MENKMNEVNAINNDSTEIDRNNESSSPVAGLKLPDITMKHKLREMFKNTVLSRHKSISPDFQIPRKSNSIMNEIKTIEQKHFAVDSHSRNLSNQRYSICESIRTIKDPWKEYKSTIKDKHKSYCKLIPINKGEGLNWDKFKVGPQLSKYAKNSSIFNQRKSVKLSNLKDEESKDPNIIEEKKNNEIKWIAVLYANLDPILPTNLTFKCRCVDIPPLDISRNNELRYVMFRENCSKSFPDGKAIKSFQTKEGDILYGMSDILEYKENCVDNFKDLELKHSVYDNPDYCYIIASREMKLNQNIKELLNLHKHTIYKKISKQIDFYNRKYSRGENSNIKKEKESSINFDTMKKKEKQLNTFNDLNSKEKIVSEILKITPPIDLDLKDILKSTLDINPDAIEALEYTRNSEK